jgi:hypothetical protein
MYNHKIHLTLDEHEAKVLRQILKERTAFCAKEEKVLKRQGATHMYTQTFYAARTIKARALYELVSKRIHDAEIERHIASLDITQVEYPGTCEPEMSVEELLNQHPEGLVFGGINGTIPPQDGGPNPGE